VSGQTAYRASAPTLAPARADRPRRGRWAWRRWAGGLGPACVVSMAYVDPGNVATNTTAGATHGYLLLWVIAVANAVAMFVQYLSAKLGIATGRSLAELCRDHCPRSCTVLLWVQAEAVAIATDLAELIGGALALRLLFGVPMLPGVLLTAVVALALLAVAPRGRHRFETVLAGLLLVVLGGFLYQALAAGPSAEAAAGMVPHLAGADSVLLATGIVGATVMPHVVYLHSSLTRSSGGREAAQRRATLRRTRRGITVALGVAGTANMAMLVVAADVFHGDGGGGVRTLTQAHAGIEATLGSAAAVAFAVALLAAGLASSSVGTYAGQAIMDGFLRRRVPLLLRRGATLVPAVALLAAGLEPTRALILSQVALSFGIPFALAPLVVLTSRCSVMGALRNRPATTVAATAVGALIGGLNLYLLAAAVLPDVGG
jgi:manganese transport protein